MHGTNQGCNKSSPLSGCLGLAGALWDSNTCNLAAIEICNLCGDLPTYNLTKCQIWQKSKMKFSHIQCVTVVPILIRKKISKSVSKEHVHHCYLTQNLNLMLSYLVSWRVGLLPHGIKIFAGFTRITAKYFHPSALQLFFGKTGLNQQDPRSTGLGEEPRRRRNVSVATKCGQKCNCVSWVAGIHQTLIWSQQEAARCCFNTHQFNFHDRYSVHVCVHACVCVSAGVSVLNLEDHQRFCRFLDPCWAAAAWLTCASWSPKHP